MKVDGDYFTQFLEVDSGNSCRKIERDYLRDKINSQV